MEFNIADGMWWDQFNNYDRFVQWMQAQKIDMFAICEAATHWDENKKNVPKNDEVRYLPGRLGELAARWGHTRAEERSICIWNFVRWSNEIYNKLFLEKTKIIFR